jgi:hypothetical protein
MELSSLCHLFQGQSRTYTRYPTSSRLNHLPIPTAWISLSQDRFQRLARRARFRAGGRWCRTDSTGPSDVREEYVRRESEGRSFTSGKKVSSPSWVAKSAHKPGSTRLGNQKAVSARRVGHTEHLPPDLFPWDLWFGRTRALAGHLGELRAVGLLLA